MHPVAMTNAEELRSIRGGSDGRLALDLSASESSAGANKPMSGESIERDDSARLFDHSWVPAGLNFLDGHDFSG